MFLAAIAHSYSFPHYPFHLNIPHYSNSWYNAFAAMLDISDIHQDVTEHLGVVGKLFKLIISHQKICEIIF